MRSIEQIEKLVKRSSRWHAILSSVSIALVITLALIPFLVYHPSRIIPSWTMLLVFPMLILALVLMAIGGKIENLVILTSGEKFIVLLGRLIKEARNYGLFSGRDRKRSGKRVQWATRSIEWHIDETFSHRKQDLISREREAFSKDLKLVMSGLRKCVQRDIDIPPKTVSYLQSIISQKDELHEGYHEACQKCGTGGSIIRAYLVRSREHLQAAGIDDATPEITKAYILRLWLSMQPLLAIDLIGLVMWGLIAGFLVLREYSTQALIAFLVGFLMIPPFVHTLAHAYERKEG